VGGKLTADRRGAIAVSRVLVRLGSLLPLLAAAASISNKSTTLDSTFIYKFSEETSKGNRLPSRTSKNVYGYIGVLGNASNSLLTTTWLKPRIGTLLTAGYYSSVRWLVLFSCLR
jgi:hypothetical protein